MKSHKHFADSAPETSLAQIKAAMVTMRGNTCRGKKQPFIGDRQ